MVKRNLMQSIVQAAGAGGPDVKSKDFLRATNVIRKEVESISSDITVVIPILNLSGLSKML